MIISNLDPNLTLNHFLKALYLLFLPASKNTEIKLAEQIKARFSVSNVRFFDSGRTALCEGLLSLKSFKPVKTEVIISAYTCTVVINAILKAGLTPIYCDINPDNLGLDQSDLQSKINANTLAVITQNTFGIFDDIISIKKITQSNDIYLIEDLAHTVSVSSINGDFAFLSFGSNKIVTSSRGGALLTNNSALTSNLASLATLPTVQVYKHLFKVICFYLAYPVYNFGGKYILAVFAKLGFFPKVITHAEKVGDIKQLQNFKLHPALQSLALVSFKHLDQNLRHRAQISALYLKNINSKFLLKTYSTIPSLFFPVLVRDPIDAANHFNKHNITVQLEWSLNNIVPLDANHKYLNYTPNSCPNAENIAKQIINLPTHIHITPKKAYKVINTINKYSE